MAVKYRIEHTSIDNVDYQCDISNPSYSGAITTLEGNIFYGMNSVEDSSHPIRSKYLRLVVGASTAQPLDDLLTQPERYWRVELYRDSNKIFFGYLTPENTPNDFTRDNWDIEFDALGPLGFLEDLAYVDLAGSQYGGKEQLARVIANCLKRGFEDQTEAFNMLSYEYFDYQTATTQYTGGRLLKDTEIYQDIFNDADSGESQGCLEVLEKVLKALQLTVTQVNGDTWLLEHYLFGRLLVTSGYINSYDKDGNDIADLSEIPYSPINILTDTDALTGNEVIHANANQSYYYKRAFDKITVDNEYLYRESLLENPSFDGGVNGVSMPNWSVNTDYSESRDNGLIRVFRYDSAFNPNNLAAKSGTAINVVGGQRFKVRIEVQSNFDNAILSWNAILTTLGSTLRLGTVLDDDFGTKFGWVLESSSRVFDPRMTLQDGELNIYEFELPEIPGASETLEIELFALIPEQTYGTTDYVEVYFCDVLGNDDSISGESTTVTADTIIGIKAEKDDIYLSTNGGEVQQNQLFKLSLGDPITGIVDKVRDNGVYYALQRMYAWNRLAHYRQKKIFSGGFYNFFEPHRVLQIPDLDSATYRIIEYEFDTKGNIGELVLEERTTQPIDHTSATTPIYEDTIEPKIE